MPEPRFRVFDVVEVPRDADWSPGDWAVAQVRVYDDGRIAYAVTNIDDDNGYVINESELTATDRHIDASAFEIPGPVKHRDVVMVDPNVDDELAGQTGSVTGWSGGRDGEQVWLEIWFDALGEAADVPLTAVAATGERGPPRIVPRRTTSALIGPDGATAGEVGYVVADEVEAHL